MTYEQLEDRRLMAVDLRLLKDINLNLSSVKLLSHAEMGAVTYLGARTSSGDALWRTDGTETGTFVLRQFSSRASQLDSFTAVNNTLFFVVDSELGKELWKSDGTSLGTTIVRDINPGRESSNPKYLTNVAGMLYFSAQRPQTGTELWKSDGTVAGTVQVRDIVPGTGSSNPTNLTAMGSTLYFSARSGSGTELFKSNGTSATTVMVRDLAPGIASSNPSSLVNLGGSLYFSASISATDSGLWKTNGTAATTTQVRNLQTTTDTISGALVVGNRIFFSAAQGDNRELWMSDGTLSGTLLVKDILPGPSSSDPRDFAEFGGQLFFSANGPAGRELWRSNGTSAGTFQVKDIQLGNGGSAPEFLRRLGSTLYFVANDGTTGRELWKSNGTSAGTVLVKDFIPGPTGSFNLGASDRLAAVNGKLLLAANADAPDTPTRLWTTAGTEATTTMLRSVGKETADSNSLTSDPGFVNLNGTIYFAASSAGSDTRQLWKTNGTSSGTVLVKQFAGASVQLSSLVNMAGTLYFVAGNIEQGFGLWKSDGTTAGTVSLANFASQPVDLTAIGSTLYFAETSGIWKSDGTAAGTVIVLTTFFNSSRILFTIGSSIYLTTTSLSNGTELGKYDGIGTSSTLVKDIRPGPGFSLPSKGVKVGTRYYFTADDGSHGRELWSTLGTEATTALVKDIEPGIFSSKITEMTAVGSTLFFSTPQGLWKSNGSAASTVLIANTPARYLTNVSGKLFFAADAGPERGRELWMSDGTTLGTSMVKDIQPGPEGSNPADLKNIGGRLYFSAYTRTHGVELWSSNGTAAGTILEKDINPGVFGSSPKHFFVLEDQMMLVANGANAGRELFAEPASIIGPTGRGQSQPSVAVTDRSLNASSSSPQAFDLALLAWNKADESDGIRRARMVFGHLQHVPKHQFATDK